MVVVSPGLISTVHPSIDVNNNQQYQNLKFTAQKLQDCTDDCEEADSLIENGMIGGNKLMISSEVDVVTDNALVGNTVMAIRVEHGCRSEVCDDIASFGTMIQEVGRTVDHGCHSKPPISGPFHILTP
ncbi:hypothetical protein L2E82_17193 [Cichorium intybus]|uniref:Uncharacterized protein n=1 Tax=Cichorium intybus TaxID=13427 RepID=A0ACB9F7L7_CICIN|nr:hypothetical protein L2E82_17193 [Cichorium intybus]